MWCTETKLPKKKNPNKKNKNNKPSLSKHVDPTVVNDEKVKPANQPVSKLLWLLLARAKLRLRWLALRD